MGEKITLNTALRSQHPLLSDDCRCVLACLREREMMATARSRLARPVSGEMAPHGAFTVQVPSTLQ